MKYCYQCGRITAGKPFFCSFCGRSYDAKLCPRLHPNPRVAEFCSQCGSRELSTPQPKISVWWKVLEFLAKVVLGTCLVYITLAGLVAVLKTPHLRNPLIVFGILLAVLWSLWSELPHLFRKLVRRSLKRKERTRES